MGHEPSKISRREDESEPYSESSSMADLAPPPVHHAVYTISNWLSGLPDSQAPMPSPNVVQKSSAKKTPQNAEDLGQKLAKRKSQNLKSKIGDWNETGAGVAQKQDEVVVIEEQTDFKAVVVVTEPDSDLESNGVEVKDFAAAGDTPQTPKTPVSGKQAASKQAAQRKAAREVNVEKKAWVRRKSKPQVETSPDVKKAGVPKKRVVSDGHWRRDRLQKKESPTPEKEKEKEKEKDTTPKPVTIRRSVVSVGLKIPPSVQDFGQDGEPIMVRSLIRRPRSRSRDRGNERAETPDYESSGTKVYVKRRRKSTTQIEQAKERKGLSNSESSFTASSSFEKRSSATDITTPEPSPTKEYRPRPTTAPRPGGSSGPLKDDLIRSKSSRPSLEAEDVPRRVSRRVMKAAINPDEEDRNQPRSANPAKVPTSKSQDAIPKVFGTRIEGWLAGMPDDPFTEPSDPSLAPQPLEIPRRKSRRVEDTENDDGDYGRRSSNRRRRSRQNLEPIDNNERSRPEEGYETSVEKWLGSSPVATTPTLKRSGARRNTHSPVKDRSPRGSSEQIHGESSPMDLQRAGSRRNTSSGLHGRAIPSPGNQLSTITSVETFQPRPLPLRPRAGSNSSEQLTIIPDGSVFSRASDGDEPARNGGGLKRRLTKHADLMSVLSLPRDDEHKITSARSIRTRRIRNENATVGDLMNEVSTDELKYQRELRTLVDGVIPVLLTNALSKGDSTRSSGSPRSSAQDKTALTQPIYEMGVALEKLKASHKRIPMHDPNELLIWFQSSAKIYSEYLRVWRLGFENIMVTLAPAEESEKKDGLHNDGERVDVAYLLKRPLVRVKNFTKMLTGISQIKPSALAADMTTTYEELVLEARRRANDERARLEDEAAAAIDPTRARDPRSLALLNGVNIDPTRNVRARDFFDMQLIHSSGQQLDCKIEIVRRDNAPSCVGPGDVLFCEVSSTGKWLLFPPVLASHVSARKGDREGELLVMVRGMLSSGNEWREIMALQCTEEQAIEWIQMLGSIPMPPRLTRQSSFNTLRGQSGPQDRPVSPAESEVPIGEQAKPTAPRWDGSDVNSVLNDLPPPLSHRAKAKRYRSTPSSPLSGRDTIVEERPETDQTHYGDGFQYGSGRLKAGHTRSKSEWVSNNGPSSPKKDYTVWLPSSDQGSDESSAEEDDRPARRPTMHRRTSSIPSADFPAVPKLRKSGQANSAEHGSVRAQSHSVSMQTSNEPSSAPSKLQKQRDLRKPETKEPSGTASAAPLPSRPTTVGLRPGALPSFTPEFLRRQRRSSSPLKREYEPSIATGSSSDSDLSDIDDNESLTSDTSVEDVVSTIGELKDFSKFGNLRPASRPKSRSSFSPDQDTLGPSDSPSQRPYRTVPPAKSGSAKSLACIFSWAEQGSWDTLHPEECEIVVTPGLIEAFDLGQAHAVSRNAGDISGPSPSTRGVRPLVALELTPLVPLRRGTALDISIRSPPTSNSVLRKSNNIMFRSRSPEECEKLYGLINRARIDNPTWIALQNARGPVPTSNWAEAMERRNASRTDNPSWMKALSRKGSTYRSKGSRPASFAASQTSVGTMNSAISAIRRFSGGSIFNIAKSTINSKESTRSSYSSSLSSGAATPLPIDPTMGTPVGITNAKCRFYMRETDSKWRDMGSSRLTIMIPPRANASVTADPKTTGLTKRILICGKSKGEVLFDEVLFENSFERINRTGIAVTVWQELMGPNGEVGRAAATGGVSSSRTRTYMIQMRSEREAAYTFSMVGKLRY